MLIILLPWIRAATDKHPTCIATGTHRSYMATAPHLYNPMTHGWRRQHGLTETSAGICRSIERYGRRGRCILQITMMQQCGDGCHRRRTRVEAGAAVATLINEKQKVSSPGVAAGQQGNVTLLSESSCSALVYCCVSGCCGFILGNNVPSLGLA